MMSIFANDGKVWCIDCPFDGDEKRCAVFHEVPYDTCPTEETYDEIMKSLENEE